MNIEIERRSPKNIRSSNSYGFTGRFIKITVQRHENQNIDALWQKNLYDDQ